MNPDIEWHIDETADEEIIFRTEPPVVRWRAAIVLVAASLGIGLGVLYASIPEPTPRPTALPAPIQNPDSSKAPIASPPAGRTIDEYTRFDLLRETVEQEVAALADGSEADFLALQDHSDADWLETQRQGFSAWGRPSSIDAKPGALYFYSGNTLNTNDQEAWFDISQYRQGRTFRETRFYRWQIDRWVRVRPPLDFWNGAAAEIVTPRFRVLLPQADQALAADVMRRLEFTYEQICFDLACPAEVITPAQPLRVLVSPALAKTQGYFTLDDPPLLRIPSPRISGLLDEATSFNRDDRDPLTALLYARLSEIITRAISGGQARWSADSDGVLYLIAIAKWELQRGQAGTDLDTYIGTDLLRGRKITLPQYLWDWPVRDGRRLASPQAQANSVVAFIDRSFGAERVVHLLRTLRTTQSLPQAIEATLPISYPVFEQQWQQWLIQRLGE